jgi:hypothetical protein
MALSSKKTRDKAAEGRGGGVLRIPQGIKTLKVDKAGTIKMAILPYTVPVGAKHPVAKDGDLHYARDYYVHNNLGSDNKGYAICPRLSKGGKCPICEGINSALETGELTKETAKRYYAKQRTLYTVWLPEQNQVVLFDHSFFSFSKQLNISVSAKVAIPGREWIDYFADPAEGAFIYVTFAEKTFPGGKCYEAVSFDFDRHGGVPDAILAQALQLDNLLVIESAETLRAKFYDEDADDASVSEDTEVAATVSAVLQPPPTPKPLDIPKPTAPEPKVQRPVVTTTLPPAALGPAVSAPAVSAPAAAWPAKGDVAYHAAFGKVTIHKNTNGVISVFDSEDEPRKVSLKDLSREPQAQAAGTTPEVAPEPAPASAGSGSDEAWDSEWPDQ